MWRVAMVVVLLSGCVSWEEEQARMDESLFVLPVLPRCGDAECATPCIRARAHACDPRTARGL